ncbi:hypothetical protein ACTGJ9_015735 [Bradyrhizobium sp. RDM12]
MRALDVARLAFALTLVSPVVHAAEPSHEIKGLYLMTDYPAITVRPGTTTNVGLRLQDYGLSPERYQLSVAGVPSGWTATLLGGGQPVGAAMPGPDSSVALQLRLDVPAGNDLSDTRSRSRPKGRAPMPSCRSRYLLPGSFPPSSA